MGAGVLHAGAAATRFTLNRYPPPEDLAPFVDFCWVIRWDLRGQPPHEQQILPHPNVNLAFEASGPAVYGVDRKIFTRRLSGVGQALGVRFRPGGFRPFSAQPIVSSERSRGSRRPRVRPGGGGGVYGGDGGRRR